MNILEKLTLFYDGFSGEKGYIGYTERGKLIPYFKIGNGKPCILAQYAIHAREYITAYLALKQIEKFLLDGASGTAYFIPIVNPDGVNISTHGSPLYKANGRGVDLNVNFDALWGKGVKNAKKKGEENYIGEKPFSEPETIALRDFTLKIMPTATVSYHSKGEEIYYQFHQKKTDEIKGGILARAVRSVTGYNIKNTPFSCGGYKDWCISKLKIPALTIEVGEDKLSHPIGKDCLDKIYEKNERVVSEVMKTLTEKIW
jgi:g-D-glutamyl-meso-diaminopimelate peptidase